MAALRAKLEQAESYYRKIFCEPFKDVGYIPEYVEGLESLATEHFRGLGASARIAAEISALKEEASFAVVLKQQSAYHAILKIYAEMESGTQRAYEVALGKSRSYDEMKYNQAIAGVYPGAIKEMESYLGSNRQSPYYKEIALLVMEAREDLAYARE